MASINSKYNLTKDTYTDSQISLALQLPVPPESPCPQPTIYAFDVASGAAAVTCRKGVLTIINPPLDPVAKLVFTKDTLTAFGKPEAGGAVDYWIRVD